MEHNSSPLQSPKAREELLQLLKESIEFLICKYRELENRTNGTHATARNHKVSAKPSELCLESDYLKLEDAVREEAEHAMRIIEDYQRRTADVSRRRATLLQFIDMRKAELQQLNYSYEQEEGRKNTLIEAVEVRRANLKTLATRNSMLVKSITTLEANYSRMKQMCSDGATCYKEAQKIQQAMLVSAASFCEEVRIGLRVTETMQAALVNTLAKADEIQHERRLIQRQSRELKIREADQKRALETEAQDLIQKRNKLERELRLLSQRNISIEASLQECTQEAEELLKEHKLLSMRIAFEQLRRFQNKRANKTLSAHLKGLRLIEESKDSRASEVRNAAPNGLDPFLDDLNPW